MKKWLFAILIGSALVLGACGSGDNDDGNKNNNNGNNNSQEENDGNANGNENNNDNNANVDTAAAEEMFKNSCASCHGDNLDDGFAPDLTKIGSKYDADEIATIIKDGKGSMQPQNVPDDERAEIAEWLASKK